MLVQELPIVHLKCKGQLLSFNSQFIKTLLLEEKLDTKFTQIQIVPPMQYQVMQTQMQLARLVLLVG